MRCKCGYNSFESNPKCPKCRKDLATARRLLSLTLPPNGPAVFFNIAADRFGQGAPFLGDQQGYAQPEPIQPPQAPFLGGQQGYGQPEQQFAQPEPFQPHQAPYGAAPGLPQQAPYSGAMETADFDDISPDITPDQGQAYQQQAYVQPVPEAPAQQEYNLNMPPYQPAPAQQAQMDSFDITPMTNMSAGGQQPVHHITATPAHEASASGSISFSDEIEIELEDQQDSAASTASPHSTMLADPIQSAVASAIPAEPQTIQTAATSAIPPQAAPPVMDTVMEQISNTLKETGDLALASNDAPARSGPQLAAETFMVPSPVPASPAEQTASPTPAPPQTGEKNLDELASMLDDISLDDLDNKL